MTYTHNQWSTLFNTVPAGPGVGGTDGVPLYPNVRFVCQVAKITAANVDNSPVPTWVDISAYVTTVDWLTGTIAGEMSRWPMTQWSVTVKDLTALLGDFVDLTASSTSTAPSPGMFLRWGVQDATTNAWAPLCSGFVETIEDIAVGRVRGWRFQCYGTLIYYAGSDWPLAGVPASTGLNLRTHIVNQLDGVTTGYGSVPWPFDESIEAQDGTLPGLIDSDINGNQNKLALLHRLADSMGKRIRQAKTGAIIVEAWGTFTSPATAIRISDEPAAVVAGHAPVAGTITGLPRWIRSQDRTAGVVYVMSPSLGVPNGIVIDAQTAAKWDRRTDVPGFPKFDLVCTFSGATLAAMLDKIKALISPELRIDHLDMDTAQDALVWGLLNPNNGVWLTSRIKFERRRPGTAWFEIDVDIIGVAGTIDFATGIGRARISYFTRMVTS